MKLLRLNSWWNAIVPQLLGWIYFSVLTRVVYAKQLSGSSYLTWPLTMYEIRVCLFFIALISIAAFGYLFNDFCDVDSDARAGKPNALAAFNLVFRVLIVGIPLLTGVLTWVELNKYLYWHSERTAFANFLFGLQLLALVLYSAPPFRLKERAEIGVIFDAFYGHLNPVLIVLFVFGLAGWGGMWAFTFMVFLVAVCSIKGIRNILLHQIEDRKKDESSGLNTAVTKYGPWRVINLINNQLFPAEIFCLVSLTIVICIHFPPLILPIIFFAIVSYLKFSGWKLGYADRRLIEFKFSYFMNDYYEGWFPVFTLIILSVYRHEFVFLLILHLILFPMFVIKLIKDFKAIRENFKTEEDY